AGLMGLALLSGLAFAECARLVSRPAVPTRLRPLARSALAALLLGALYAAYQLGRDPIFPRPPLPASYPLGVPLMPTSPLLAILRHPGRTRGAVRSEEHTSELQSRFDLVCRLLLEKKKND